ncbi:MAG: PBP1A family penicillin-binding protein [Pseudomonadota bacterium]|nr:PBP1A family penicillin-binding protein [Pseudomonadota bacterium]
MVLPSVSVLLEDEFQVPMRIYTTDGDLIAEFGEKHRLPVQYSEIPQRMVDAIVATEDKRFFNHFGVDFISIIRAVKELAITGKKSQGASTITMQVARNFFLSKEKTYSRKINEILLSFKIEYYLTKKQILELYLNKIFLGHRAYGIKAAARNYYGKDLNDLSLAQYAMLAGLPKAPSSNNPIANPHKALIRRNYVLASMLSLNYITNEEYTDAIGAPMTERIYGPRVQVAAPHAAELVRRDLVNVFGKQAYTLGLKVYTTIDSKIQTAAVDSLTKGVLSYDKRHGLRSSTFTLPEDRSLWPKILKSIPTVNNNYPAGVIKVGSDTLDVSMSDGEIISLTAKDMEWALYSNIDGHKSTTPNDISNILVPGNIVYLTQENDRWQLTQNPGVDGALVALNPKNGAILALNGGYHFYESNFNRATQAKRQMCSLFKPFVFSAALENGFTLASVVNDSPVVVKDNGDNELWRPNNVNLRFLGPTNLREALVKSRNLVAVRILDSIGIQIARDYIKSFGFSGELEMPSSLSLALGSGLSSPLQATVAYSPFANGGNIFQPYLIAKIVDQSGKQIVIPGSRFSQKLQDKRVISETNSYLINSVLQDVIKRGTGRRALALKREDLAGKTGTTNDQKDAWFCGYNQDIVATVWVGFDNSASLYEYASQLALPIWIDFMKVALNSSEDKAFKQPPGIVTAKVNYESGMLTTADDNNSKFEIFDVKNMPSSKDFTKTMKKDSMQDLSELFG